MTSDEFLNGLQGARAHAVRQENELCETRATCRSRMGAQASATEGCASRADCAETVPRPKAALIRAKSVFEWSKSRDACKVQGVTRRLRRHQPICRSPALSEQPIMRQGAPRDLENSVFFDSPSLSVLAAS